MGDGLVVLEDGRSIPTDSAITIPCLEGPRTIGLPANAEGFIPVDAHGRVKGIDNVYVAGDGADFPVKQGGLATQQADAAAEAIAAGLGSLHVPEPFKPVLRAVLLTGATPIYLRANLHDAEARAGESPGATCGGRPERSRADTSRPTSLISTTPSRRRALSRTGSFRRARSRWTGRTMRPRWTSR